MKEFVIDAHEADQRLDRFLKKQFPHVPYGLWARLARTGKIRLDKKKVPLGERLYAGQVLTVRGVPEEDAAPKRHPKGKPLMPKEIKQFQSWVLYENDHFLALNKPQGTATQGGIKVRRSVDEYLHHLNFQHNTEWKLVHRLDRDTSGVLLVAKNTQAARALTEAFKKGLMDKTYWAMTLGVPDPEEGEIRNRLKKRSIGGQELMVVDDEGDFACTEYRVKDHAYNKAAFVELKPQTGRTHQLRVHMQGLGTPILGDPKYRKLEEGQAIENIIPKLHLHAYSIRVPSLLGAKAITVTAPPSDVLVKTSEQIGFELSRLLND